MATAAIEPTAQVAEQLGVEFLEFLGQGAQGTVYKARRLSDNQLVAIKAIDMFALGPNGPAAVQTELDLQYAVSGSPFVVQVYDWYTDPSKIVWITLELCDGGEVTKLVEDSAEYKQPIPEVTIWMYMFQLVSALQHCHEPKEVGGWGSNLKIVHGDLKLPNLLINKEHTVVKIADFGLSVALQPGQQSGNQVGTLDYMAPELCVPNVKDIRFDASVDIWSLGCVGKELCNLSPAFADDDDEVLKQKIRCGKTDPIPDQYSPDLAKVLDAMLSVDPNQRPTPEDMLALPGFQLGRALTELSQQDVTIAELRLRLQEQDIRLAQYVEIDEEQAAFASALEQKTDELETFQKQLEHANTDSEVRAVNVKKREQAVQLQEQELRQLRQELEQSQASLVQQQTSLKAEQLQQQTVLDERKVALDQREADIAAREQSLTRNAVIRDRTARRSDEDKPKVHGPMSSSAPVKRIKTASDRAGTQNTASDILAPSRNATNLPGTLRTPAAQTDMHTATRSTGAKGVSLATSSATTRVQRPLPRGAAEPTAKPTRPVVSRGAPEPSVNPIRSTTAVVRDRGVARSAQVATSRPTDKTVVPAPKSDTRAQFRPRSGVAPVPTTLGGPARKDAVPKRPDTNPAACSSAGTPQRKIRSAGEMQTSNKVDASQTLAEPARKWTTGQLRKPADSKTKTDAPSASGVARNAQPTSAPKAIGKPALLSRVPPSSTWARATHRGTPFVPTLRA